MKAILGRKLGMSQVFKDDKLIPVTLVEAGPCVVVQINERQKGASYQIGFGEIKDKKVTKPMKGHFAKVSVKPKRYLTEFTSEEPFELGQEFKCDIFIEGDTANVTSVSKGKGYQGVVKRWGFAGGPGGHGSHFHRAPGSVGMAATPSRVHKGQKLPGQMGSNQVTVKNLEVIDVDIKNNTIYLKGAVPGSKGTLVLIKSDNKIAEPRVEEVIESQEEKSEEKPKEEVKEKEQKTEEKTGTPKEEPKAEEVETAEVKEEAKDNQVESQEEQGSKQGEKNLIVGQAEAAGIEEEEKPEEVKEQKAEVKTETLKEEEKVEEVKVEAKVEEKQAEEPNSEEKKDVKDETIKVEEAENKEKEETQDTESKQNETKEDK